MFKHYFKLAIRSIIKERLYSFINILGLSVGVAVAVLMLLFATDEWSFDKFHSKSDRIYRLWVKEHFRGDIFFNSVTPFVLGRAVEENFPEVESMARYITINSLVENGTITDQEPIHFVSPSFFDVFGFPMLEGNRSDDLKSILVTPSIAQKYFGTESPVGKTLAIEISGEAEEFAVRGVIDEAPANSSIQFSIVLPFENAKAFVSDGARNSWTVVFPETYILLGKGQSIEDLSSKVATYVDKEVSRDYKPGEYVVGFQPLTDIHLNNEVPTGIVSVSDGRYPYIMGTIALLILLLAGINFVTLAVGRSVNKAKEVGVRKVTGASRFQLMIRFWGEAVLIALIAVVFGVLLAQLALPSFNTLASKSLSIPYGFAAFFIIGSAGVLLGIIAGLYPALVVSGFSPTRIIRGTVSKLGSDRQLILRSLVGLQFVLSIGLISSTMIMRQQLSFLQNKNLGYEKDQMLVIPYSGAPSPDNPFSKVYQEGRQKVKLLENELAGESNVLGITSSSHALGTSGWLSLGYTDAQSQQFRNFNYLTVDPSFLPLMDIPLSAGRNFSEEIGTDRRTAVIVNEAYARQFDIAGVGQRLPKPFDAFEVIGIVEDFNFSSLHTPITPLVLSVDPVAVRRQASDSNSKDSTIPKITIKVSGQELIATIKTIEAAWKKVAPDQAFSFSFIDETLDNQYRSEQRLGTILALATLLAVFIACLGLFGIATLAISRKTKEIGVRKVLGASVFDIVLLLNRRFTILVVIAGFIAAPLVFYLMKQWLADFAYRISINPFLFFIAILVALVVAWLSVGYQSFRAASTNPVNALKYE